MAILMFLAPFVWAEEYCNIKVLKLEEELQKVDDHVQTIQSLNTTIRQAKSSCKNETQVLNATIQELKGDLADQKSMSEALSTITQEQSNTIVALNRTIKEQADNCKQTTEALNATIQQVQTQLNSIPRTGGELNWGAGITLPGWDQQWEMISSENSRSCRYEMEGNECLWHECSSSMWHCLCLTSLFLFTKSFTDVGFHVVLTSSPGDIWNNDPVKFDKVLFGDGNGWVLFMVGYSAVTYIWNKVGCCRNSSFHPQVYVVCSPTMERSCHVFSGGIFLPCLFRQCPR